jgi:hypothetical protein
MALAGGYSGNSHTGRGFYGAPSGNIWCPGGQPHQ